MKEVEYKELVGRLCISFGVEPNEAMLENWYMYHLKNVKIEIFKRIIPMIERAEERFPPLAKIMDYLDNNPESTRFRVGYLEEKIPREREDTGGFNEPLSDATKKSIEAMNEKMGIKIEVK